MLSRSTLAVPIVVQLPSIVAVLACTMASRNRWIAIPAASILRKYPREIQSATMWLDLAGSSRRTSTPRAAASTRASTKLSSGMK